jgi:hypothetical protein
MKKKKVEDKYDYAAEIILHEKQEVARLNETIEKMAEYIKELEKENFELKLQMGLSH